MQYILMFGASGSGSLRGFKNSLSGHCFAPVSLQEQHQTPNKMSQDAAATAYLLHLEAIYIYIYVEVDYAWCNQLQQVI